MFVYLHTILSGGSLRNVTIWKRAPTRAGRTKRRRRPFAAAVCGARKSLGRCSADFRPVPTFCRASLLGTARWLRPPYTLFVLDVPSHNALWALVDLCCLRRIHLTKAYACELICVTEPLFFMRLQTMATLSRSEILKSKPIGDGLQAFCDTHESNYEELNDEGSVLDSLSVLSNASRTTRSSTRSHPRPTRSPCLSSSTLQSRWKEPT
jgi:hypothetical protein